MGAIRLTVLFSNKLCKSERKNISEKCKSLNIQAENLGHKKEHFWPNGSGLLQDDPTPILKAQGLTEWFEGENDANHKLWASHISN